MNYLQSDIFQLIKDTKKAAFLLNSKTFDKTNWLTLHCPKGPQGVFASVEWLHFSNLERHLNNVISPSTQIFEKISDIQCNTPLSSDIQMQIKKSAELTLFELSCAKSRIFQVSQTAHDMEVHNKTFYTDKSDFIHEKKTKNCIRYSRTNVFYPKLWPEIAKQLYHMSQSNR